MDRIHRVINEKNTHDTQIKKFVLKYISGLVQNYRNSIARI